MATPYQVVGETANDFTVIDPASGQPMRIARAGLTDETQAMLSSVYQQSLANTPLPDNTGTVNLNAPPPTPTPMAGEMDGMRLIQGAMPQATAPMAQPTQPPKRRWDVATPGAVAQPSELSFDGELPGAKAQQSIDTLMKNEKGIINELAKNQEEQGRQALTMIEERNAKIAEHQKIVQENEARRSQELDKFYTDINTDVQEIGRGIDPDRYWKKGGGGNKLTAILSMALGAVGQAFLRSNQNVGIDLVMKRIDQDIDAQKEELANKRSMVGAKMNMLGQLRDKYNDERIAENVLKQGYLEQAMQKLELLTQKSENKNVILKAADMYEQLRAKTIPLQLQIDAIKVDKMRSQQAGAVESDKLTVPGVGVAYDDKAANEARQIKSSFDVIGTQLGRLIEMRNRLGSEKIPGSENRDKAAAIATSIKAELKNMLNVRGFSEKIDEKLLSKLVPSQPLAVSFMGDPLKDMLESYTYLKTKSNAELSNRIKNFQGGAALTQTWETQPWAQSLLNAK